MKTGDLKNIVLQLDKQLKRIQFHYDPDYKSLIIGCPTAFLKIYNYTFLEYSKEVWKELLVRDFELSGKSDMRFMETIYKCLMQIFGYKPVITRQQFFSKMFIEHKIIMCTEILRLVEQFHQKLTLAKSKMEIQPTKKKSSQAVNMRTKSLNEKSAKMSKSTNKNTNVEEFESRILTLESRLASLQMNPSNLTLEMVEARLSILESRVRILEEAKHSESTSSQDNLHPRERENPFEDHYVHNTFNSEEIETPYENNSFEIMNTMNKYRNIEQILDTIEDDINRC